MLGDLTTDEINNVLTSQSICRIACADEGKPYVTPVTYAYDGKYIYIQSKNGKKVKIMRKNPQVCVQVDIMNNPNFWKSVIVNGVFEELKEADAEKAKEFLFNKVLTLLTSSTVHGFDHSNETKVDDTNRNKPVMYRIKIESITGRYEK